ncbi:hypothetical protein AVEN_17414-1 [Araneus ventricosus]|uniref:Uncharacterized protein n=1 Tax=Araneus ventricosus TaxID=182803 RepID=A0A4Y2GZ84_ARAVE|nr:hypothetical protein AVEN_17414-1 [Araneus ventricosus]
MNNQTAATFNWALWSRIIAPTTSGLGDDPSNRGTTRHRRCGTLVAKESHFTHVVESQRFYLWTVNDGTFSVSEDSTAKSKRETWMQPKNRSLLTAGLNNL